MTVTDAAIWAVVAGLAVSLPFYFTTRHLNKKNWGWDETGEYLREMNHVSLCVAVALFAFFFVLMFGIGVTV